MTKGIMVVISGFSGAGKGTLMKRLLELYPERYALSVSMTTRQPRPGEEEGVSYFFRDRNTFEQTIAEDGFIEYASYCENYYGTPRAYVEQQMSEGRDVILEIEIQGALKVKQRFPETLLMFVATPTAAELERRLTGRGTESAEVIRQRMARAAEESDGMLLYDNIVINDDLDQCAKQIHEIIQAAKTAAGRNREFIANMQAELKSLMKGE